MRHKARGGLFGQIYSPTADSRGRVGAGGVFGEGVFRGRLRAPPDDPKEAQLSRAAPRVRRGGPAPAERGSSYQQATAFHSHPWPTQTAAGRERGRERASGRERGERSTALTSPAAPRHADCENPPTRESPHVLFRLWAPTNTEQRCCNADMSLRICMCMTIGACAFNSKETNKLHVL